MAPDAANFDSIVFDLDGTLWDTCNACAVAWNQVLADKRIDFREVVAEDVRKVTGKPHDECIRLTFPELHPQTIDELVEATAIADNEVIDRLGGTLYPGVIDGLRLLRERYRLFIVSNCQSGYIETFLRLNGLGELFEDTECFGNTGQSKSVNLGTIIFRNELKNPLMFGDADGDEKAAQDCGIPFAFAEYGFGCAVAPDYRFNTFGELAVWLLES